MLLAQKMEKERQRRKLAVGRAVRRGNGRG